MLYAHIPRLHFVSQVVFELWLGSGIFEDCQATALSAQPPQLDCSLDFQKTTFTLLCYFLLELITYDNYF